MGYRGCAMSALWRAPRSSLLDLAWRTAFRLGFPLARIWWQLTRPRRVGVAVAVYVGDALLLVRPSYRAGWHFPGGSVRRGETPEAAARRELAEEIGLRASALLPAGSTCTNWDGRRDRVHFFELRLAKLPKLRLDNREIIEARLTSPAELQNMVPTCQTARNRDPGSAWKRDPLVALGPACPGSEQEGPPRVAQCPHERRSGARGRCLLAHRGKPGWHSGAVLEAPAVVSGLDDFAVMGQAVEQRGGHLGVAKDARPFAEGQIGRDDDRGALVEPADQMKQQLAAGLREGEIAEFVEHDEIQAREIFGKPALAVGPGFVFEPVDEVDDGVKAASPAAADAGPRNGDGQMRLAGASAANQYGIALLSNKGAARQIADQRLVDRRAGKVEVGNVFRQRQLGNGQLVFDRARLLFSDLGVEQIADDAGWLVPALDAGDHHLIIGRSHPVELERRHQLENVGAFHQAVSVAGRSGHNRQSAHLATAARRASGLLRSARGHGAAPGC